MLVVTQLSLGMFFLDALRGDGKAVEAIVDLITKNPEARLRLWLNVIK